MTRATPELAPPLQTSTPHQREAFGPPTYDLMATGPIHDESSLESGFEPGTLWAPKAETLPLDHAQWRLISSETSSAAKVL
ncbi:hypothetical protein AVEN_118646-1 [Araneus ventricosus]|uniref:Uncharacterized protein n=1 Tax=Araneus ventricosus TaxID=182803 RepID=A0A4Y2AX01_ARAVE|nr:hypothetical protein AVEN_118646-1 [Araneus ventricosus]